MVPGTAYSNDLYIYRGGTLHLRGLFSLTQGGEIHFYFLGSNRKCILPPGYSRPRPSASATQFQTYLPQLLK